MEGKKAFQISKNALKACYDEHGIVASRTHFNSYWARDSFYASWGSLELKDFKIVKKNLELFLKNMKEDGQIPLRIGASKLRQILSFKINCKKNNDCVYSQDKGFNAAIDPNLLLIITLEKYVEKTKDFDFAKKSLEKLRLIVDWLESFEKEGLIFAGKYATWQDMIKKRGFVLYTNVLYYKALISLSNLLESIDVKNEFLEKAAVIKENINKKFWNKKRGFYIDYYNKKISSRVFSSDGNFFAILFEVADKKQTDSILKKAERFGISKDTPSYTNYPKHKWGEIYIPFYIVGMQDYNVYSVSWTWIGALHSMVLFKAEKKDEAKKVFEKLAKIIERDKDVYEVYEKSGKPLKRFFYKSEHPFSWSAGFYILADNLINKKG